MNTDIDEQSGNGFYIQREMMVYGEAIKDNVEKKN